jgi:hypothetical protein
LRRGVYPLALDLANNQKANLYKMTLKYKKISKSTSLFTLLLALVFCSFAERSNASGRLAEKPQAIKLERFRKALWTVRISVKGKTGDFLFDTGGGVTLLGEEFSKGVECEFWGRNTGYNMFGKRFDGPHCDGVRLMAGNVPLSPVNVGKIDFGDQFAGDRAPDGLLSLDAFDGKAITLDQSSATLTIETAKSLKQKVKNMIELPFRVSRECSGRCLSVFVGVPTAKGMTWLTLDSGAGGVSLIAKEYATVFRLDPEGKDQRLRYEIARSVHVDSPVIVADMIMDGNLGQPFLSQYIVTMDLLNSRLWVRKTS